MIRKNMMMKTKKTFLFFLSIVISGCAVGPDFQQPVLEAPESYIYADSLWADSLDADSLLNFKWWQLFDDPILDTLVTYALENNKNVLIAISRIEEARATLGFTKADIYPKLDIQGNATRGNLAGTFQTESISNYFFIAPVVNWEIDFWGKFRRANEAARAELLATHYGLRTIQISLISEVIGTYFLLLDFHKRLNISKQTLDSRLEGLDIIQKRFDSGIIPEIDLNQSQIQKEIAAAAIPLYERAVVKTENTLSILLGKLPGNIEEGIGLFHQSKPPEIPPGIPSLLLKRRPDIIQAEYLLMAQNARIGVAQAMRFPAINLTGILGVASDDLKTLSTGNPAWSLSGSLFGPLFNFNKNSRRVEIEEARTRQALLQYENTVLIAFLEVEDALVEVKTYSDQIKAVTNKYNAAKNANNLSQNRYDKGVTSYLEVLDTERTLFSVELELSELQQQYYSSYVRLYKALGGGWISEEEMIQAENSLEED